MVLDVTISRHPFEFGQLCAKASALWHDKPILLYWVWFEHFFLQETKDKNFHLDAVWW